MLVLLPINGWWYDYTGFPKIREETVVQGVESSFGIRTKVCNFSMNVIRRGFLEDHIPGRKRMGEDK